MVIMEIQKKIIAPEEELKESHRRLGMKYLSFLRNREGRFDYLIELLQSSVENGEFTLDDIGTTKEELKELWTNGCKGMAREELSLLREGTSDYDIILRNLRRQAQQADFDLEEIGTSEQELEELRIKCSKILAQKYLKFLRLGVMDPEFYMSYLEVGVQRGDFTLKDIKTSEEELEKLRHPPAWM